MINFKKNFLLFTFCLGLSLYSYSNVLYEQIIYNKPNLKEETEVYLGDRMLVQQVGEWKECITPKKTFSKKSAGWTGFYKANEPICKRKLKDKNYWPTYMNATGFGNEQMQAVSFRGKKGKYTICQTSMGMRAYCVKDLTDNDVVAGDAFVYTENTLQQTIEYSGRSGDVLKFNYSEFYDGFARQAFTREFQIDLGEGNVAAFKGAIIEVIEATNVQIKYKVIRNFSSDI